MVRSPRVHSAWATTVPLPRVLVTRRAGTGAKTKSSNAVPNKSKSPRTVVVRSTDAISVFLEMGESEKTEEAEEMAELLRDRFRLSVITIAEAEGTSASKRHGMEIKEPVVACISDLAFKFAEVLANDVRLFAQHAGRKSVNMEDVMLSAHRNEHLLSLLRSFSRDLKGKEPKTGKTRKRPSKKEEMIDAS
ncbi:hypothetical protein KSP40_PGU021734 [Platanthera guangdongensis]|uniref:Centromere protein S n=1 Tax=Platanthera guangdongensis TaxID=2320717 RepID=A0ABR2N246_9ASPA